MNLFYWYESINNSFNFLLGIIYNKGKSSYFFAVSKLTYYCKSNILLRKVTVITK